MSQRAASPVDVIRNLFTSSANGIRGAGAAVLALVGRDTVALSAAFTTKAVDYANFIVLSVAAVGLLLFSRFTAEDAFITYRYAENLVNIGSLVYNVGEPINALTSPLHALLSAALFYITGNTVLSNKIVALLLLLISARLIWQRFQNRRQLQVLALGLVLMPPSILLWTFGGLETPVLLFFVTLATTLAQRSQRLNLRTLSAIFLIAGFSFLTRYDSILFFFPLLVYAASRAHTTRHVIVSLALAAILPAAWLMVSVYYYGDLLPTSFYVKTPNAGVGTLIYNGFYIASYLVLVGLIPAFVLTLVLPSSVQRAPVLIFEHVKRLWWLYTGIILQLLYGMTMATHHMMFSFRFFVPFLPAAVILVVDLVAQASEADRMRLSSPATGALFAGFLVLISLSQLYQSFYTYSSSLNGVSPLGEYQALGVREYVRFIHILEREALDIERHWNAVAKDAGRQPRIITYAAGALPYTFRDSYIYEQLVSYRHCHRRYQQGLYADYIHIMAPRHGAIEEQLPKPLENYSLVSSYEMFFDGSNQRFLVYYNPAPGDHNLSQRINDPCRADQ